VALSVFKTCLITGVTAIQISTQYKIKQINPGLQSVSPLTRS